MLIHGGAKVALVEYQRASVRVETFLSRLEMVFCVLDSGALVEQGYGSDAHINALATIEERIAEIRAKIDRLSKEEEEQDGT